jgi:hypothetical protein
MNIDRMEFIAWMERIMERFDILKEYVLNIKKERHSIDGEELLDNQDLLLMLKISHRSLQRYRSKGKLPYYTISGKLYYKPSVRNLEAKASCKKAVGKVKWGRFNKRIVNDVKVTDHHGLLITEKIPSGLTAHENVIYDMIAHRLCFTLTQVYCPQWKMPEKKWTTRTNGKP